MNVRLPVISLKSILSDITAYLGPFQRRSFCGLFSPLSTLQINASQAFYVISVSKTFSNWQKIIYNGVVL